MTRVSVRGLTEGAILAALVALLAAIARYLPVFGVLAIFICPLPLVALVIRHGLRIAVLAAVVAAAIGTVVAGPLLGAGILLAFAPLGITIGFGIARGWSASRVVLIGSVVGAAVILGSLGATLAFAGVNPYTVIVDSMRQSQERADQFYRGLGVPQDQLDRASAQMRQAIDLLPRLVPVSVILAGAAAAWLNLTVGRIVLGRFGYRLPRLPSMREWEAPVPLMWLFVLGFILMAWGGSVSPTLETAGLNLTVLMQVAFTLQGLIVAWVLMERYGSAVWLRWVAIVFALTNPLFSLAAFFLGLADAAFFLRERWRTSVSDARTS